MNIAERDMVYTTSFVCIIHQSTTLVRDKFRHSTQKPYKYALLFDIDIVKETALAGMFKQNEE